MEKPGNTLKKGEGQRQTELEIEAILFASGDPVSCEHLSQVLGIPAAAVRQHVNLLQEHYEERRGAIQILQMEDSYQMCSREQFAETIQRALRVSRNTSLSQAALEVLAIIAYNQPVTRQFIEQIRGVDSTKAVNTLVERSLIEEAGRLELPGRPISYRTTEVFLRSFGISSLQELPPVPGQGEKGEFSEEAGTGKRRKER